MGDGGGVGLTDSNRRSSQSRSKFHLEREMIDKCNRKTEKEYYHQDKKEKRNHNSSSKRPGKAIADPISGSPLNQQVEFLNILDLDYIYLKAFES